MLASLLFQLVVGSGLIAFGWWARGHADQLSPGSLPAGERARRAAVIVRGSWACLVAGVVFYLMAIPLFVR